MQVRVLPVRPEQSGKTDTTNQDIPGFFFFNQQKPKKTKAVVPSVNGGAVKFFQCRDDARHYARAFGLSQRDLKDYSNAVVVNPEGLRWFVIL